MAERTPSIHQEDILHKGYLKKQGGAFRTWQRRWFVLAGECLYYYNKEDDVRPLGNIPLRNNKVEKHPHNPDDPGKFLFEIISGQDGPSRIIVNNHESFLLWATSQMEADEWIQHIRRAIYGRKGGGIFGQSLLDTITYESNTRTRLIPNIVEQCCDFLRDRGLREEGIFRLPGRASVVRELQEQYDCGETPDFYAQNADIHTVASLFKLYLRQLPEPVIPWPHYQFFYEGIRTLCFNEADGRQELIRQLAQLPRTNYNLLKYICSFLHEVQTYESTNKMTIMNLATVFGPNIFRPKEESTATLMESTAMSQKFVHLIIENQEEMFPPNSLINFSPLKNGSNGDVQETTPTPPPRNHKARQVTNTQPNIDLLKELKQNLDNLPPHSGRSKADIMQQDSMLITFDSDEEFSQMMGRSSFHAVNKRTQSVDGALDMRNSMGFSDSTLADSSSTLEESGSVEGGNSGQNSRKTSFSDFQDAVTPSKNTPGNRESLVLFNPLTSTPPLVIPRKDRPKSISDGPKSPPPPVSPRKSKPSLPMDLTSTTPEVSNSNRQSMDLALQYSSMQDQLRTLKAEMIEVKDDRDQRVLQMKLKCEGLQINLLNEETLRRQAEEGRRQAEERNKQLLKQLNSFIDEYGPKLSSL